MRNTYTNSRGFTLIEIILYVSVAGIVLYSVALLYSVVISNEARNYAHQEVEESAAHTLLVLTRVIREAESAAIVELELEEQILVLQMSDPSRDPTTVTLSDGIIDIQEGEGSSIPISSGKVSVDTLEFSNRSESATSSSIHIEFGASYRNATERAEFTYAENFYGTATTR